MSSQHWLVRAPRRRPPSGALWTDRRKHSPPPILRCDNAETDPRVNLETCRAFGIASIVVLPLLRRSGEVRGLFELFSDHPYAFEERDLIALERMADLTLTALDFAEQRHGTVPPPPTDTGKSARPATAGFAAAGSASTGFAPAVSAPVVAAPAVPALSASSLPQPANLDAAAVPAAPAPSVILKSPLPAPAPILESPHDESAFHPEAALHVQKCAACGFPVSEGRTLCLDCDKLHRERRALEKLDREKERAKGRAKESRPKRNGGRRANRGQRFRRAKIVQRRKHRHPWPSQPTKSLLSWPILWT